MTRPDTRSQRWRPWERAGRRGRRMQVVLTVTQTPRSGAAAGDVKWATRLGKVPSKTKDKIPFWGTK